MVPAVALKVAVVAPAATVTDPGTVSSVLFDDSVTAAPPVAAAFDSVTVQVLAALELRLAGAHASVVRFTAATSLMAAVLDAPLKVAVTVAFWSLGMVP